MNTNSAEGSGAFHGQHRATSRVAEPRAGLQVFLFEVFLEPHTFKQRHLCGGAACAARYP